MKINFLLLLLINTLCFSFPSFAADKIKPNYDIVPCSGGIKNCLVFKNTSSNDTLTVQDIDLLMTESKKFPQLDWGKVLDAADPSPNNIMAMHLIVTANIKHVSLKPQLQDTLQFLAETKRRNPFIGADTKKLEAETYLTAMKEIMISQEKNITPSSREEFQFKIDKNKMSGAREFMESYKAAKLESEKTKPNKHSSSSTYKPSEKKPSTNEGTN